MILPWQQKQFDLLRQAFLHNRLSHAYLFSGIEGLGKTAFATVLAQLILCESSSLGQACGHCYSCKKMQANTHPDFLLITPYEKNHAIKIDQIRALSEQLAKTSHRGAYQVVIISPADAMPVQAANALLKTLEEPPGNVVIFLIDHEKHGLPATIVSRCQHMHFNHHASDVVLKNQDSALREAILSHLFSIISRRANPIAPVSAWVKNDLSMMLDIILLWCIDLSRMQHRVSARYLFNPAHYDGMLNLSEKISFLQLQKIIELIKEKKEYLMRGIHLNAQLCLENVFIQFNV